MFGFVRYFWRHSLYSNTACPKLNIEIMESLCYMFPSKLLSTLSQSQLVSRQVTSRCHTGNANKFTWHYHVSRMMHPRQRVNDPNRQPLSLQIHNRLPDQVFVNYTQVNSRNEASLTFDLTPLQYSLIVWILPCS